MKNKKSPLKFVGAAMGAAGAALGTQHLLGGLRGLFGRGGGNAARHTGVGGLGADYAGQGSRVITPATDTTAQFNPAAVNTMEGIFGNVAGRQATLGASGMYALEKHLSPLKNEDDGIWAPGEADALFDKMKYTTDANIRKGAGADLGTIQSTSSELSAYKPPNPPYDPESGDDGAGGTEYDTN